MPHFLAHSDHASIHTIETHLPLSFIIYSSIFCLAVGGPIVKKRRTEDIVPMDYREATLTLNKSKFRGFPVNDVSDFDLIRSIPQYAYFDRTQYISVIESILARVLLFLRPRRFGKSLTLSTLAHFHGVEHKERYNELFLVRAIPFLFHFLHIHWLILPLLLQNLDVDNDVKAGKVTPGQYLILSFNFAGINRPNDFKLAEYELGRMIIGSLRLFYRTYAPYLGRGTCEELIQRYIDPNSPTFSLSECVYLVQDTLRAAEMISNHPLADVKGVSNRLCLFYS